MGGDIPAQWGRQDEIDSNKNLFDPGYVDNDPSDGTQPPVDKIFMDVKWEDADGKSTVQWQKVTQDSGEDWYTATVFFNFDFTLGPDHLVNNPGSKAQFTVRNAGTPDNPHWQLVEFRDLDLDL